MHTQPWEGWSFRMGTCPLVCQRASTPSGLGLDLFSQASFSRHLCGPFINYCKCSISQDAGGATSCLGGSDSVPRGGIWVSLAGKEVWSIYTEGRGGWGGTLVRGENTSVCRWHAFWEPFLPLHPPSQLRFCASQHLGPTCIRALTRIIPGFTHVPPDLPVVWE